MRGFVPDFVQLAHADGRYRGRILAVQRESDHRSAAAARQDTLYTLILRGLEGGATQSDLRMSPAYVSFASQGKIAVALNG
jgi:hypothetical protein